MNQTQSKVLCLSKTGKEHPEWMKSETEFGILEQIIMVNREIVT